LVTHFERERERKIGSCCTRSLLSPTQRSPFLHSWTPKSIHSLHLPTRQQIPFLFRILYSITSPFSSLYTTSSPHFSLHPHTSFKSWISCKHQKIRYFWVWPWPSWPLGLVLSFSFHLRSVKVTPFSASYSSHLEFYALSDLFVKGSSLS